MEPERAWKIEAGGRRKSPGKQSEAEIRLVKRQTKRYKFRLSCLSVIDQDESGQADDDSDDLVPGDRLMIQQISDKDQDHGQYG